MRVWITNFKILSKSISFSGLRRERGKKIKIKIKRGEKKGKCPESKSLLVCVSKKAEQQTS